MGLSSCNNYETSNGTNDKIDPSMLNYESIYNSHKNSKIYTEEEANDLFKNL